MMKRISAATAVLALALVACSTQGSKTGAVAPIATAKDSLSYVIGQDMGMYVKELGPEVVLEAIIRGMRDQVNGATPLITAEQAEVLKREFSMKMQAKAGQDAIVAAAANTKSGDSLQAENKKRKEVTTTASGLQFETLRKGTGPKPTAGSTVTVHYVGTLVDGTEFDNSYKRGQPATFPLGNVIKGWQEGLLMMNEGGKYRLVVPPTLGYGERGAGQDIGPNATLIFEVELLKANQ
jgi:FKBP-type peptidyl-prolyl cis-trans isomerase